MDPETAEKIKQLVGSSVLEKLDSSYDNHGCISQGKSYNTDKGRVFIKSNTSPHAREMFESEMASLEALEKTGTIRVPHPIGVVEGKDKAWHSVVEFLEIRSLSNFSEQAGKQIAELHLHNENVAKHDKNFEYISKFGFPIKTCVGLYPVDNTWSDNWPLFYRNRLAEQVDRLKTMRNDNEAEKLWSQLEPLIPQFFENIEIKPSLLHGDLWYGNIGEIPNTEPVIFDAGCVYGHHEFELSIAHMFGSIGPKFHKGYHKLIPKAPGFDDRMLLYKLFHYLNHWNHFGGQYKSTSLDVMKKLVKTKFPPK